MCERCVTLSPLTDDLFAFQFQKQECHESFQQLNAGSLSTNSCFYQENRVRCCSVSDRHRSISGGAAPDRQSCLRHPQIHEDHGHLKLESGAH